MYYGTLSKRTNACYFCISKHLCMLVFYSWVYLSVIWFLVGKVLCIQDLIISSRNKFWSYYILCCIITVNFHFTFQLAVTIKPTANLLLKIYLQDVSFCFYNTITYKKWTNVSFIAYVLISYTIFLGTICNGVGSSIPWFLHLCWLYLD